MTILRYTGHPFIDVGVATIMAWVKVREPHQVTYEHLEKVAEELREIYVYLKPVRNFISTIFLNSHFVQPAKSEAERWQYANEVLFAFREDKPILEGVNCTFFPELPAVMYAHRQYIPLLNGQDISNFSGWGTIGIPISGIALLAIHAMPLGCMKCGHLMAFHQLRVPHEDSRDMTLALAKLAFDANKPAIQMMFQDSDRSLPSFGSYQKTRYV
ncbi:MAG: hypothetical protein K8I82_28200, partial [Anaerolineae bacterium]|nr:hypothetical protein [Anaerolineae bacterium]